MHFASLFNKTENTILLVGCWYGLNPLATFWLILLPLRMYITLALLIGFFQMIHGLYTTSAMLKCN